MESAFYQLVWPWKVPFTNPLCHGKCHVKVPLYKPVWSWKVSSLYHAVWPLKVPFTNRFGHWKCPLQNQFGHGQCHLQTGLTTERAYYKPVWSRKVPSSHRFGNESICLVSVPYTVYVNKSWTYSLALHPIQAWQTNFLCGDSDYFWDSERQYTTPVAR